MRTTGIAVAAIGLLMALFAGVVAPMYRSPAESGSATEHLSGGPDLSVPLTFAVAAMLIGGALFLFGGRSYIATQNPAVRN